MNYLHVISTWAFITFLFLCLKMYFVRFFSKTKIRPPCSTLIVLGSGGHTTEMMTIVERLDKNLYSPRVYVMAASDVLSERKVEDVLEVDRTDYAIEYVHRVREVGQSWITTLFYSLPKAFIQSADVIKYNRPSLVICNGPGICVPICLMARFYQVLFRLQVIIIYVESICRVKRLSLTGKIMKYLVDRFVVQWPDIREDGNHGTMYFGRIS